MEVWELDDNGYTPNTPVTLQWQLVLQPVSPVTVDTLQSHVVYCSFPQVILTSVNYQSGTFSVQCRYTNSKTLQVLQFFFKSCKFFASLAIASTDLYLYSTLNAPD